MRCWVIGMLLMIGRTQSGGGVGASEFAATSARLRPGKTSRSIELGLALVHLKGGIIQVSGLLRLEHHPLAIGSADYHIARVWRVAVEGGVDHVHVKAEIIEYDGGLVVPRAADGALRFGILLALVLVVGGDIASQSLTQLRPSWLGLTRFQVASTGGCHKLRAML